MRWTRLAWSVLFAVCCIGTAEAAVFQIKMLNHGTDGEMQFAPPLLVIAPGDTVQFLAIDKGHNAQSVDGMIPDGAKPFASGMGESLTVTLTTPGVYGYRCNPHGTLGMVGLIVVGSPVNEDTAKSAALPGAAGRAFAKLFQVLDSKRTARN